MKRRIFLATVCLLCLTVGCSKKSDEAADASKSEPPPATGATSTNGGATEKNARPMKPKPPADKGKAVTGLPSYPNAKVGAGPDDTSKTVFKGVETSRVSYTTSDQPGAVADYYKKILKNVRVEQMDDLAYLAGETGSGAEVIVTAVVDYENKSLTHIEVIVSRKVGASKK